MSVILNLKEFGISCQNGFLPDILPLHRLPGTYFNSWESIIDHLPRLLKKGQLRAEIDKLPILSASHLKSEREWQRAYSVLGFLTHAYIWGGSQPRERLPPSISLPFLEVAAHLELPPTATYAGLNLWNFAASSLDADLTNPDNLNSLITFTGTLDEAWFYLISVAIEAHGGAVVYKMLSMIDAVSANDPDVVTSYLVELTGCITGFGVLLERMYEKCDPYIFCYQIRPFLAGSKNMASAGLKNGVFYDEGNGQGRWHQYSGGSNAQSSLLQFFDIILGVEHRASGHPPAKAAEAPVGENPFIQQMRKYMPGPHSRFLTWLSRHSAVRPYILTFRPEHKIVAAYNSAVAAFTGFRDKHLKLVARYIIAPSRNPKGPPSPLSERRPSSLNLASATKSNVDEPEKGDAQGTGGTALIPFLKQTRDETKMAARG